MREEDDRSDRAALLAELERLEAAGWSMRDIAHALGFSDFQIQVFQQFSTPGEHASDREGGGDA